MKGPIEYENIDFTASLFINERNEENIVFEYHNAITHILRFEYFPLNILTTIPNVHEVQVGSKNIDSIFLHPDENSLLSDNIFLLTKKNGKLRGYLRTNYTNFFLISDYLGTTFEKSR